MAKETDENTGDQDDAQRADAKTGESERTEKEIEAGAADSGDSEESEDSDEGERDADDKGDPARAALGLRKRVQKLTAQRNEARSKAAETDKELQRYRDAERRARQAEEEAERRTPEGQKSEHMRQAIRRQIDETYGDGTSALLDNQREIVKQQSAAHAQKAYEYLGEELEAHGIDPTPEALLRWEKALGSELEDDEDLGAAFRHPATLKDTISTCFERVRDGLVNPTLAKRGAEKLARIERNRDAVLGGGRKAPVAETPEPKFDFTPPKDATPEQLERFWADAREKTWTQLGNASDA